MKIGEVAVISHKSQDKDDFIRSICQKIDIKNELVSFGRYDVNDQLALHLYGVSIDKQESNLSWDLISRKMLGYVVIFDWDDKISVESIKPVIDSFSLNSRAPFVLVANLKNGNQSPIPPVFFDSQGISLAANFRFTFGQVKKSQDARKMLVLLINMLLERLNSE